MSLVIKGAYYYDKKNDMILVPHFTGEFYIVDCDRFMTMEKMKTLYDKSYIEDIRFSPMEYRERKFYYAEFSPEIIEDWILLSDLSDLHHQEEIYSFK